MTRTRTLRGCLALLACLALAAVPAQAQEEDALHWAYGPLLGTGWYSLDRNRDVFVLSFQPEKVYREPQPPGAGQRRSGLTFHFPVTLGLQRVGGFGDFLDLGNVGTVAFTPGAEWEFPVNDRWRLRAYGHLGWGSDSDGRSAWIYDAGLKSRVGFQRGELDWGIVGEVFAAGYRPRSGAPGSLAGLMAGVDFSLPVPLRSGRGEALDFEWDVTYTRFVNELTFRAALDATEALDDAWEVGLALARRAGPTRLGRLEFDRLGLTYRFSSTGEFEAVTINLSAPFDR